jgi:hypothetical protein
MFITRVNDVAGMNWITATGCTSVHQREIDTTVFNQYLVGSPNFGGDNVDS